MNPTIILFIALMFTWTSLRMLSQIAKEGYEEYQRLGTLLFNAVTAGLWCYFFYLTH